jgi:hypothetical protein
LLTPSAVTRDQERDSPRPQKIAVVKVTAEPTQEELAAAHCWERDDRVPRNQAMTAFRRAIRYHQARWREANGHPVGTQPIAPRPGDRVRLVGSRLPLDYAKETGASFITRGAWEAARQRSETVEPHQTLDQQRLWADLLSSVALACNLFGDLAADLDLATRAVRRWWPDAWGTVTEVRFAHSPGRFDKAYLGNLRAFNAAFVLDMGDGSNGIIAVETTYHERAKAQTPRPSNIRRYLEVAKRSGAFRSGALDILRHRSDLATIWLEHLLLSSMLQHPSGTWKWGKFVVVHPAGNTDMADVCARYEDLLADRSTFNTVTLEQLLRAGALARGTEASLRKRYLPS